MDVAVLALIGATVYAGLSLVKYVRAGDTNAALTLLTGWVVGVVVVFVCSAAKLTNGFTFNHIALVDLDAGSKILLGVQATSLFAVVPYDFKRAFDRTDSAQQPSLLSGHYHEAIAYQGDQPAGHTP